MSTAATTTGEGDHRPVNFTNHQPYHDFLGEMRDGFDRALDEHVALFTTDAAGLYDAFLGALPSELRQEHACRACTKFVDEYGGLVAIGGDGRTVPVMWSTEAPEPYADAFRALRRLVARARVNGVHVDDRKRWGTPKTGEWQHMAVTPPKRLVFRSTALKSASQRAAELSEEYRMLQRGLADFPTEVIATAHRMLDDGTLYRSHKHRDLAAWLLDLSRRRDDSKGQLRNHITWREVASAPAGWCHVRSGMIGTLLEDIVAGMPADDIKRRFDAKMSPLQYLRPQAAPKAGAVAQAEKVVDELDSAGALRRRFAGLGDIRPLWLPEAREDGPKGGGIFGGLARNDKPKPSALGDQSATAITWEKFAAKVLPDAREIEVWSGHGGSSFIRGLGVGGMPYYAFTTAVDPDATPILQWDREEDRNPVAWYTHHSGSSAAGFNLAAGAYVKCVAVTLFPFQWTSAFEKDGKGALFVMEGCRDTSASVGTCLFPETLRSEYHGVRSVIEAHSRRSKMESCEGQHAAGLAIREGSKTAIKVRVHRKDGTVSVFNIDRWD